MAVYRSSILAGAALGLASAAASAQHSDWLPDLQERHAVASVRLVLPLDDARAAVGSQSEARLTFGLDVHSARPDQTWSARAPRLGYGFSFDGDFVYDLGHTSLTTTEFDVILRAADGETAGGSNAPWIIGGVVAVGALGVVLAAEVEDSAIDVTRCVLDPDCPTD